MSRIIWVNLTHSPMKWVWSASGTNDLTEGDLAPDSTYILPTPANVNMVGFSLQGFNGLTLTQIVGTDTVVGAMVRSADGNSLTEALAGLRSE